MSDISKNISRYEVACPCGCGFDTFDAETVRIIQETIQTVGQENPNFDIRIKVLSACRCEEYNKKIGGSLGSQHIKGKAIDFVLYDKKSNKAIPTGRIYFLIDKANQNKYGLGNYPNNKFNHFDSRSKKARWSK